MIKPKFSLMLSLALTAAFALCLVALCFTVPYLTSWYYGEVRELSELIPILLSAFYLCVFPAAAALTLLAGLLLSIRGEEVFTRKNVSRLRGISWCCLSAGLITFVFGFFYPPLFIVFAAASFMGIILRVVKNVMERAVEIKSENELTI